MSDLACTNGTQSNDMLSVTYYIVILLSCRNIANALHLVRYKWLKFSSYADKMSDVLSYMGKIQISMFLPYINKSKITRRFICYQKYYKCQMISLYTNGMALTKMIYKMLSSVFTKHTNIFMSQTSILCKDVTCFYLMQMKYQCQIFIVKTKHRYHTISPYTRCDIKCHMISPYTRCDIKCHMISPYTR